MRNSHARLIALPLVMIAGSLYSVVQEEYAILLGACVFLPAGFSFVIEYKKSLKDKADKD